MSFAQAIAQPAFWCGLFGGCIGNLLRIVQIASMDREARPQTFSDPLYYVQFLILAFLGGVFAFFYELSGTHLTPILAVNIGAAAPIIAQQFLLAAPIEGSSK